MPTLRATSIKSFALTSAFLSVAILAALGQQQDQPQKNPSPGIAPTAPPAVTGVDSLVSTCTTVENGVPKPGTLVLRTVPGGTLYDLMCVSVVQNGQLRPNSANVWTSQDSQAQFNFLRAEVKSSIENAVTDKVVNSATIQDAVRQVLQDDQRLRVIVADVLNREMDNIENKIVADVLAKLKTQQATPQTAQPKKPQ